MSGINALILTFFLGTYGPGKLRYPNLFFN
jgi:hypothetical protein